MDRYLSQGTKAVFTPYISLPRDVTAICMCAIPEALSTLPDSEWRETTDLPGRHGDSHMTGAAATVSKFCDAIEHAVP